MKTNALHPTKLDLTPESRQPLVDLLNHHLADLTDLISQLNTAHWNVRGPNFFSLHKLFEEVADGVEAHLDTLAERITTLGGTALGTVRAAAGATRLPEFPSAAQGLDLVQALTGAIAYSANAMREDIARADEAGDPGTADLMTEISQTLDKSLWLLEAHILKG